MTTQIPFSPFPTKILYVISSNFLGIGQKISSIFPYLELELKQAEIEFEPEQYGAMMFVLSSFYFLIVALITYLFSMRLLPGMELVSSLTVGALAWFSLLMQLSLFPKLKVMKKVRSIEQNLLFAIRTILVEIKSGVALYQAMEIISKGDFGEIKTEFKKAVDKINSGTMEYIALEEMASYNPSLFFRRTIWQLVNGLKAGADISTVLTALVDSLGKEQKNQIKKYGSQMKLLSLMYMMLGVIVPALGFTFLIVLASFPQIQMNEILFWILLGSIVLAQFMYLGMLKSRRPNLLEA
ncbi:MAG: type II secretion system F family protein [Candidatus Diapherotrites archaeon]|nr:type II secretion system F family protein [Candidatus Diapherotrites archaeon]